MKLIGLTGGTGSGKSEAGRAFAALGAYVIDADSAVHEIYIKGRPAYHAVVSAFGPGVLDENGDIDRKKLGAVVFSDALKLEELNGIVKNFVNKRISDEIAAARENRGESKAVVLDAIRLLESGFGDICDSVVVVTARDDIRLRRVMNRDGIDAETARKRMASQTPVAELVAGADFVIENNGDLNELIRRAEGVWEHVFGGQR